MTRSVGWAGLALVALLGATGCASYQGPARSISASEVAGPGWLRARSVPMVRQTGEADCGLAAAAMVIGHHQRTAPAPAELGRPRDGGVTAVALRDALRRHRLRSFVVGGTLTDLEHELRAGRPAIVGTVKRVDRKRGRPHFEVVVAVHPGQRRVVTHDPAIGLRESTYDGFMTEWKPARQTLIVALP